MKLWETNFSKVEHMQKEKKAASISGVSRKNKRVGDQRDNPDIKQTVITTDTIQLIIRQELIIVLCSFPEFGKYLIIE